MRPSSIAALTGFLLPAAGTVWHIFARQAPPTWDDGAYLEVSFILWDRLADGKLLSLLDGFSKALGFKAPLITVLPFPFYLVAGKGIHQAVLMNLVALAVLSVYAWRIASLLRGPLAGLLAVWLVNLTPLVYGLSRHFYVETALAALCAGVVYHLLEGGGRWVLGPLLGLGLLCKLTFPLYIAGPAALLAFRRRTPRDWIWIAALAGLIASVWYGRNLSNALAFARSAGYGATAAQTSVSARPADYLRLVAWQGWGWPQLVLAALALAAAWRLRLRIPRERLADAAALAAWAAIPCLIFSTGLAPESRWCGPAAAGASVGLAAVLAAVLERAPGRGRGWLAAAALILPAAVYAEQTFGTKVFPRAGPTPAYAWNGPPEQGGFWGQRELGRLIAKDAQSTPGSKIVALAIQHRHLNSNVLDVYAMLEGWPLSFLNFNRFPTPERAIAFVEGSGARYLVAIDGLPDGELDKTLNRHNARVVAAAEKGVLPFTLWADGGLPNGARARVFKRR